MKEKDASRDALKEKLDSVELKSTSKKAQMQMTLADDKSHQTRGEASSDRPEVSPVPLPADEIPEPQDANMPSKPSRGMLRHKLTLGVSVFVALTALTMNLFDLSSLISQDGKIDRSGKFTPSESAQRPIFLDKANEAEFKEDVKPVAQYSFNGKKFGFANSKGDIVIAADYQQVKNFSDGLAAVKMSGDDGKWGFIDHTGKVVIPAIYTSINSFHDGFAYVRKDSGPELIDKKGKNVAPVNCRELNLIGGGYYLFKEPENALWGIGKDGKIVTAAKYADIRTIPEVQVNNYFSSDLSGFSENFKEGMKMEHKYFVLVNKDSCALADQSGKTLFSGPFRLILSVAKEHALVLKDDKYGFVDMTGKEVIAPKYDQASAYDDLIAVRKGLKISFIDSTGKAVQTAKVDNISFDSMTHKWLHDGLGVFVRGEKYGYLDARGNEVIAPQFDQAHFFDKGTARIFRDKRWELIDAHGKNVSGKNYLELSKFDDGAAQVSVAGPLYRSFEEWPKELAIKKKNEFAKTPHQSTENFEIGEF